ncbi:uncharacterized protein BDZ83DRAFT_467043 [Colletotrichum acutatum]|uniref:Uncharacterized protein n=1 Tax=Glomerella acutata TaxID=27357 RepID=A0AAD8UIN8_GLOAC|nr:uncharacterized protein BDZ83DRAFT_467043 [Colletotrichum acutatum]KAK1718795.1 hypothetical protein BDZ83DRAFT_467043 [Colletotrichum acutatum]
MTLSQSRPTCTSTASVSCCKQVSAPIPSAQQRGGGVAISPPRCDLPSSTSTQESNPHPPTHCLVERGMVESAMSLARSISFSTSHQPIPIHPGPAPWRPCRCLQSPRVSAERLICPRCQGSLQTRAFSALSCQTTST